MWIYFVIGIIMFVVGFLAGFYWSVSKFKSAMEELTFEMSSDGDYAFPEPGVSEDVVLFDMESMHPGYSVHTEDNEFIAAVQEHLNK